MAAARTERHALSLGTGPMVYSSDWWRIHVRREVKVSLQCVETTQDAMTESSDCLSNRHTLHSRAGCAQTYCHGETPALAQRREASIYYVSLIVRLLSVANYLYPETLVMGIIWLHRMPELLCMPSLRADAASKYDM